MCVNKFSFHENVFSLMHCRIRVGMTLKLNPTVNLDQNKDVITFLSETKWASVA
jgi:hypothetical protein